MKRTSENNLTNRLVKYSALSAAMAGIVDVNGDIIYTDMQDGGGQFAVAVLDMNGDFQGDFNIRHWSGWYYSYSYLGIWAGSVNAVLGNSLSSSLQYPFALNEGAMISSGVSTWMNGNRYQSMNWNSCNYPYSNWCEVNDKYLGLRFEVGGNTYYGWARLDVGKKASNWIIKDRAYNNTPDAPIMAGEGRPLGFEDNAFPKVKIIAKNHRIEIYNLTEKSNYKLYNLTGQSLLDGKTENDTYFIEANTISTGVYILELENIHSKEVLRKKIVL